jgi:subtilisin family serine protease
VANFLASAPGNEIAKKWDDPIFTGLSLRSASHTVDSLQAIPGVSKAWQSRSFPVPAGVAASRDRTSHGAVKRQVFPRQGAAANISAPNYSRTLHEMTGVAKLHDQGILGDNVIVAVVDNGVLYQHPAVCAKPGGH